ncbi:MAG: potassium channel family protein [Frankiaceae bacterium]
MESNEGERAYEDLPPQVRRRLLVRLSLRSGLSTVLLLVAYYCLPIDRPLDGDGVALLAVGLALFAFMLTIQVRSIVRSDRPRSRAIEVLFTVLPLFLLVFATVYFAMAHTTPSSFSQPLTRTDSLYFTVTTFSTVGFGDYRDDPGDPSDRNDPNARRSRGPRRRPQGAARRG